MEPERDVRTKYLPVIQQFIHQVDAIHSLSDTPLLNLNLSDSGLSPYTLEKLLEELGYESTDQVSNGWQYDFWITMQKDGHKSLSINGTGATFTLKLSEKERREEIE